MLYIFDWDGTLIDSTAKIIACMQRAADQVGLPVLADEEIKAIIGLGLPEAVRQLFPKAKIEQLDELRGCYSTHFVRADQTPCQFFPGVVEVLQQLREEGQQLAVATGKSRKGLNRVLANLGMEAFFDASRCADETASKPSPLMLKQLLRELNVKPQSAVMIGDTEFDLEMAANAGIASIGVSYGAHGTERLIKHKPIKIIDDFKQLLLMWRF